MPTPSTRPRIARDTRWLLIVVLASLASLSILARIRFRSAASLTGPIAPVLSQLAPRSPFEDMTTSLQTLLARLRSSGTLLALEVASASGGRSFVPAMRFREGLVASLLTDVSARSSETWLTTDRGTGLAIARVSDSGTVASADGTPTDPTQSRFLAAVDVRGDAVAVRPVFVSSLRQVTSPRWPNPVWLIAGAADLQPGCFLVTLDGVLTGLVVEGDGGPMLVPPPVVVKEAERMMADTRSPGTLGIEVQPLTATIGAAVGTSDGVVVSWVSAGSRASAPRPGDVIKAVDGQPVSSVAEWETRAGRFAAGQTATLSVWRSGELLTLEVTADSPQTLTDRPLGLELRSLRRVGVLVESVDIGSAAEAAGLLRGDVLTLVGTTHAPSVAQARAAFRTAARDRPLMVAVTRGRAHFVIAIERRWP